MVLFVFHYLVMSVEKGLKMSKSLELWVTLVSMFWRMYTGVILSVNL